MAETQPAKELSAERRDQGDSWGSDHVGHREAS